MSVFSVISCALISIVLGHLVYNAYLHPLCVVPGPLLARSTAIPSWFHAWKGDRHLWIYQLHKKYGYRVRVTPTTVLFCDSDAYTDMYSPRANVRRSRFYTALRRDKHDISTLNTVDVAQHARMRKLLNTVFTDKSLRAAQDFVYKHIDRWNELLVDGAGRDWSPPVNFTTIMDELVTDIMGDLCFGKSFQIKEPGGNPLKEMPHHIANYMKFLYAIARSPFLDLLIYLKPRGLDDFFANVAPPSVKEYYKFIYNSVTERIALQKEQACKPESEQRQDMFHFLCEARDPDTGLLAYNEASLRGESSLLLIAGSDTTSATLSGVMFYLTLPSQAKTLAKLQKEIRTTFESPGEIRLGSKLSSCVYLKACIDEGLRLSPPGPSELGREVCQGGITIKDEFYPAGTEVGWPSWSNNHNTNVHTKPDVYFPERWIVDESRNITTQDVIRARMGFHPFAAGPGNCVGQKLAVLQMQAVIARTLWRLDVRRVPGSTLGGGHRDLGWGETDPNVFRLVDAYIAIREGPEVQFRRRQD